jgi:rubrerythrin
LRRERVGHAQIRQTKNIVYHKTRSTDMNECGLIHKEFFGGTMQILKKGIILNGVRPPKPFNKYYYCQKCSHHFEGILPICPKCGSFKVKHDIMIRA